MKLFLCTLAFALSALMGNVDASINNKKHAAAIQKQATSLPVGKYKFRNLKTGKYLTYSRGKAQSVYPASGKGSWFSVKKHHKHVVISPTASNNKCLSAQWDYDVGADWAAMLYECSVAKFARAEDDDSNVQFVDAPEDIEFSFEDGDVGEDVDEDDDDLEIEVESLEKRTSSQGELRGAKQYFYFHGSDDIDNAFHIVPEDHLADMKTRAMSAQARKATYNKHMQGPGLAELNDRDKSQLWQIFNAKGKLVKS